jgi:hypothetical protein
MPEIEFTLKVRWAVEPGVQPYEGCSTVEDCLQVERDIVGIVYLGEYIETMLDGDGVEVAWRFAEVPEAQDITFHSPRGH